MQGDNEQRPKMRQDIDGDDTVIWVHSDVWDALYLWYGGGPAFPRRVFIRSKGYVSFIYLR